LFVVQHLLSLDLYGDDLDGPEYLELEVGIVGNSHEPDVAWSSKDDVIGYGEVDHLERECFGAVVARVSEDDR
jgi:hypothetical protein